MRRVFIFGYRNSQSDAARRSGVLVATGVEVAAEASVRGALVASAFVTCVDAASGFAGSATSAVFTGPASGSFGTACIITRPVSVFTITGFCAGVVCAGVATAVLAGCGAGDHCAPWVPRDHGFHTLGRA